MLTTRVKICGITRPEDAALAAELGADAIGLNFMAGPRRITVSAAHAILEATPGLVNAVALCRGNQQAKADDPLGLFDVVNASPRLRVTTFQLYGASVQLAADIAEPFQCWFVFPITSRESLIQPTIMSSNVSGVWPRSVTGVIFDTASEKLGGTGQSFNWNWIAEARAVGELDNLPPLILAGGLTPDNVADAIRIAKPYAVDVSSGVEIPNKPGIKDPLKLRDFIQAAKSAR
ncbi:MAG TPA: phosphoribosylanthranilate isomerase [Phycisphaerae bacterium]|nr:phosphoribosylanthranilate isomerase [Phycisphaerae bacterium]